MPSGYTTKSTESETRGPYAKVTDEMLLSVLDAFAPAAPERPVADHIRVDAGTDRTSRTAPDLVIEVLALSEAELRERVGDLRVENQLLRETVAEALHMLHRLTTQAERYRRYVLAIVRRRIARQRAA